MLLEGTAIVMLVVLALVITFIVKAVTIVRSSTPGWSSGSASSTRLSAGTEDRHPVRRPHRLQAQPEGDPLDTPSQVCITKDNTQLAVDGVLFFQVTDPQRASYGSSNYIVAITQLAQTTLRSVSASSSWTRPSRSASSSTTAWCRRSTRRR